MSFRSLLSLSCAAAMLAACSSSDEPAAEEEAAAAPTPQLTSTPTPIVADDGSPLTPGSWTVNESASGASASFGEQGKDAQIVITCARDTKVMASGAPLLVDVEFGELLEEAFAGLAVECFGVGEQVPLPEVGQRDKSVGIHRRSPRGRWFRERVDGTARSGGDPA